MGGPVRGGHRIPRADIVLQNVRGTNENGQGKHLLVFVVRMAQVPVGIPAPAVDDPVLCNHVDFVPDAVPSLYHGTDERVRCKRFQ